MSNRQRTATLPSLLQLVQLAGERSDRASIPGWTIIKTASPVVALLVVAMLPFLAYYQGAWLSDTNIEFMVTPIKAFNMTWDLWQNHFLGFDGSGLEAWFFPYGVFFAVLSWAGLPTWLCQHLWAGTMLFGIGISMYVSSQDVLRTNRVLPRLLAAFTYQSSPFILDLLPSTSISANGLMLYAILPLELWIGGRIVSARLHVIPGSIALGILIGLISPSNAVAWIIDIGVLVAFALFAVLVQRLCDFKLVITTALLSAVSGVGLACWWFLPQVTGALDNRDFVGRTLAAEGPQMDDLASSILNALRLGTDWGMHSGTPSIGPYYRFSPWYFANPLITLAVYLLAISAFLPLFTRFRQTHLFYASMSVIAIFMMVGAYPLDHTHLEGTIYLWLYTHIPLFSIFRAGQKFGAVLSLTYALAMGMNYMSISDQLQKWTSRHDVWRMMTTSARTIVILVLLGIEVAQGAPLWLGQVYRTDALVQSLPVYWQQTQQYIQQHASNAGVLVLPNMYLPRYQWGDLNSDVLDNRTFLYDYISQYGPVGNVASPLVNSEQNMIATGNTDALGRLLKMGGVAYVLNRFDLSRAWDPASLPAPLVARRIARIPGLTFDRSLGQVTIYRNANPNPLFWLTDAPLITPIGSSTDSMLALPHPLYAQARPAFSIAPRPLTATPFTTNSVREIMFYASGSYTLTLISQQAYSTAPHLQIDHQHVQLTGHARLWVGAHTLRAGTHVIAFTGATSNTLLQTTQLYAQRREPAIHPRITVQPWNHSFYIVHMTRARHQPTVLVFNQNYSHGWQLVPLAWPQLVTQLLGALITPANPKHWVANGFANAWIVDSTQSTYVLVYEPEVALLLGALVSALTLILCVWCLFVVVRSGRRKADTSQPYYETQPDPVFAAQ